MKILIVDDDELNRKILNDILGDAEFEVSEASDGKQALEMLEQDSAIKIILLDRMMPQMDGMQFMEVFSKNHRWRNKKVIMQTAANQPKDVIEGNSTGVYYYLTKPFDEDIVLSIVRSAASDIESIERMQE